MALLRVESTRTRHNPIDMLEELVSVNEWRHERSADEEMVVEFRGQWCEYRMFFVWQEDLGALYFSCLFDMKIPAGKRPPVSELLAMINERLWLGHFDLSSEEMSPMYRHTVLVARDQRDRRRSSSRICSRPRSANASVSTLPSNSRCGAVRSPMRRWKPPCWRRSERPETYQ